MTNNVTKRFMTRRLRFVRSEDGAALVEFAFVLPLLLLIIFGIVDFSRAYYMQSNLTSAVREGARWAAVQPTTTLTVAGVQDAVRLFANNADNTAAKFGGPPVGGPGGGTIALSLEPVLPGTQTVRVTVSGYPFQWLTPLPGMIGFGDLQLAAEAVFRWEWAINPPAP